MQTGGLAPSLSLCYRFAKALVAKARGLVRDKFIIWRGLSRPAFSYGVSPVALGLVIWELGARLLDNPFFLAPPSAVLGDLVALFLGPVYPHLWVSFVEFTIGLALGAGSGISLGILMALSPRLRFALDPWIAALYSMPSVALATLFVLWFGVGIWSKVVVVFLVTCIPILVNTFVGIRGADTRLLEAARAFGASPWQEVRIVRLPWAMPALVAGLRLAVGRGLVGIVVGELFGARAGIGFLIYDSSQRFDSAGLLAAVSILSIAGIASVYALDALERRVGVMGLRSGRVIEEVPVAFGRPRELALEGAAQFAAATQHIRAALLAETLRSDQEDSVAHAHI